GCNGLEVERLAAAAVVAEDALGDGAAVRTSFVLRRERAHAVVGLAAAIDFDAAAPEGGCSGIDLELRPLDAGDQLCVDGDGLGHQTGLLDLAQELHRGVRASAVERLLQTFEERPVGDGVRLPRQFSSAADVFRGVAGIVALAHRAAHPPSVPAKGGSVHPCCAAGHGYETYLHQRPDFESAVRLLAPELQL